jgi:hypothetical protein
MRRKIIFSIVVFFIFFALGTALKVRAGIGQSSRGFMWDGSEDSEMGPTGGINGNESGVGWLNTNCASEIDTNGDGVADGKLKVCDGGANKNKSCNGPGAVASCPSGNCVESCGRIDSIGNAIDYGVNIPNGNGDLSGYAWSQNVGWISFNSGDLVGCPSGICSARRVGDTLEGWARVVGIKDELALGNSGGWQGFISLKDTVNTPPKYQVKIEAATGKLSSFGWSGENNNDPAVSSGNIANGLGYFDFKGVGIEKAKALKICRDSCSTGKKIDGFTETINPEESVNLRACYNTSTTCNDASGDFTDTAVWDDTEAPNNAVNNQLANGAYKGVSASAGAVEERINVSYNSNNAWTIIKIGCVPNCTDAASLIHINETCKNVDAEDNCGTYTCKGEKDCTGWREIGK